MRSIRGSRFISIDSGEQESFENASDVLRVKANNITKLLGHVMPVKLVKVEIISFDRQVMVGPNAGQTKTMQTWLATGLMVKV